MVLDASLLNTQHYKLWIKGKVEQSRALLLQLAVVATEKGAFGSPWTKTNILLRSKTFQKEMSWVRHKMAFQSEAPVLNI